VAKLVLFDVDGTLIRSRGAGVMAFGKTFETEFNIKVDTNRVKFSGRTDPSIVREFFRIYGIDQSIGNFQRFFDTYVFWLDYLLKRSNGEILKGVWNFINGLRAADVPVVIGILTGNIRLGAEIKLRHFQLWDEFVVGAFGDDHEDRNTLAKIAQERGSRYLNKQLNGSDIIVVGDTPHDIACARAIGAKALAVASGGAEFDELKAHSPDWLVHTLIEADPELILT